MAIAHQLERAAASHLEAALRDARLLLTTDELATASAELEENGAVLTAATLRLCYPSTAGATLEFADHDTAARLGDALAFGAQAAHLLAPRVPTAKQKLVCAVFNLALGLVDGVCDSDVETGIALLAPLRETGPLELAAHARSRGWLRGALPPAVDHAAAFAADVVEVFFELLHATYPGDRWRERRRAVGVSLVEAVDAEDASVRHGGDETVEAMLGWSRATSVVPFEIIEQLAGADPPAGAVSAGTHLGEAMWRLDDLVDLGADAAAGALNGVLLREPGTSLERLVQSPALAREAGEAAQHLRAAFDAAPRRCRSAERALLCFVHRYAGVDPAASITCSSSSSSTARSTSGGM